MYVCQPRKKEIPTYSFVIVSHKSFPFYYTIKEKTRVIFVVIMDLVYISRVKMKLEIYLNDNE
jgi:hypothetical protein